MNTDMESIAQMAGVRAKETDIVSVEFSKDELKKLLPALERAHIYTYMNSETITASLILELVGKLSNAYPDWSF